MSKILVIDDKELVRYTLREYLQDAGHEVIEAENGEEGLVEFDAGGFELVITDILMPKKEGIETIIEMKRRAPGQKIIAISGGGRRQNTDFLRMARELGADDILEKPFTRDDLVQCVDGCLSAAC